MEGLKKPQTQTQKHNPAIIPDSRPPVQLPVPVSACIRPPSAKGATSHSHLRITDIIWSYVLTIICNIITRLMSLANWLCHPSKLIWVLKINKHTGWVTKVIFSLCSRQQRLASSFHCVGMWSETPRDWFLICHSSGAASLLIPDCTLTSSPPER